MASTTKASLSHKALYSQGSRTKGAHSQVKAAAAAVDVGAGRLPRGQEGERAAWRGREEGRDGLLGAGEGAGGGEREGEGGRAGEREKARAGGGGEEWEWGERAESGREREKGKTWLPRSASTLVLLALPLRFHVPQPTHTPAPPVPLPWCILPASFLFSLFPSGGASRLPSLPLSLSSPCTRLGFLATDGFTFTVPCTRTQRGGGTACRTSPTRRHRQ